MNLDSILKYLGGGVVVYVVMAACGSGSRNNATPTVQPDATNSDGNAGGVRGTDGALDAIADTLMDPVTDAKAQTDASTCGTCTVAGPIAIDGPVVVSGPVKMMNAESDPAQALGGRILSNANQSIAAGPLYLTDARPSTAIAGNSLYSVIGDDCTAASVWSVLLPTPEAAIQGGRYFVPAGSTLCATINTTVNWAGFRPYTTQ